MRWDRLPQGMRRTGGTPSNPEFAVQLLTDKDGYLDRACYECSRSFKVRVHTLPTDDLTCPYCGAEGHHSAFRTAQQTERAVDALRQAAVAGARAELDRALRGLSRRSGSLRIAVTSPHQSFRPLPRATGEAARREVVCVRCGCEAAVYGADAFCAGCGPHSPLQRVVSELRSRREALHAISNLPDAARHALQDGGSIDRAREDLLKTAGTGLETYLKDVFRLRVPDAAAILSHEPKTAFQKQPVAARLYRDHLGLDLSGTVGVERWERLAGMLACRHVLTHSAGIVDDHYLRQVPSAGVRIGQKLVITEQAAQAAADDVEASVRAVDDAINAATDGTTSDDALDEA